MKNAVLILFISISSNLYCQNIEKGNLDYSKKSIIINELQNLTDLKIDSAYTIVINFYDKPLRKPNGSCIDYYTEDYKYLRFFKKNPYILQFFISQQEYKYKNNKVIEDKNNTIRNLIFQDAKSCGNYIIIKPNGDFLRKLGEYRQDQIPELIESM